MFESARIDDTLVVCHAAGTIPSAVWSRFMAEVRKKPITRYIGVTMGFPDATSVQRKELFSYLTDNHVTVVVITDERIVQGVVTAARWVGVNAYAYSSRDTQAALERAGFTGPEKIAHVTGVINVLRRSMQRSASSSNVVGRAG